MFVPEELEQGQSYTTTLSLRPYRPLSLPISCLVCARQSMITPPQRGAIKSQCSCVRRELPLPREPLLQMPLRVECRYVMRSACNLFVREGPEELAGSPLDLVKGTGVDNGEEQRNHIRRRPKMQCNRTSSSSPMHAHTSFPLEALQDNIFVGLATPGALVPPPAFAPSRASRPPATPVFPLRTPENSQSPIDAFLGRPSDVPVLAFTPQDPLRFGGREYRDS